MHALPLSGRRLLPFGPAHSRIESVQVAFCFSFATIRRKPGVDDDGPQGSIAFLGSRVESKAHVLCLLAGHVGQFGANEFRAVRERVERGRLPAPWPLDEDERYMAVRV